ncbi:MULTISPECIES: RDD family protein [Methylotenera]|uniref:RDD family protein n=1 Tax=Methylotenera TaxID=359407 RepID=UPI000374BA2B|nr:MULTISPECIES: RDD family protein [Methylotenera]
MDLQSTTIKLAHPGKRFQGQFIDGLIAYILGIIAFYLLHTIIGKDASFLVAVIIALAYFLFSDALPNGQSIGKKLLKIKVVNKETMQPCSLVQSLLRNITFPLGIFDWVFIFFGSHRRLGDFMASTIVVKM